MIYNRFYKMALKHLGASGLGSAIKIVREGESVFDPSTGEVVNSGLEITTTGIKMSIKQYLIDNETILNSDVHFYISPEDSLGVAVPVLDPIDTIEFNGEVYSVVNSKPWDFNGILIGQKVQARVSS